MSNNKRIRKMVAGMIALLVLATGCSEAEQGNNLDASNQPPAVNQEQEAGSNNGANDQETDESGLEDEAETNAEQPTEGESEHAVESEHEDHEQDNDPAEGSTTTPADDVAIRVTDITDKLMAEIQMGVHLALDEQQVKDLYGLDVSAYADSIFMPAMMNVHATEIAIVRLTSDDQYEEVKTAMEDRAKAVQQTFEKYLPNQYELSKNYQIVRNGNYVMFSITPDQELAAEIFHQFFTE